jgi:mannose-6-phosphate isomerase-like protein (cupin superfamily)
MKIKSVKATSVTIAFIWITITTLTQGCNMEHSGPFRPSGKTLVMDLSENAEYQPLLTGEPQTCGMRAGRVYLKPGETCGEHSTNAHEEMLIFLSGKGTALIGEEKTPREVGVGKICYIPPYTIHNNKNTGTEPLIYIYCVTPIHSLENEQEKHIHEHNEEH